MNNIDIIEKISQMDNVIEMENVLNDADMLSTDEELEEKELDNVSGGGKRTWQSTKILAVTYYEIKKYGVAKTYSKSQINDAIWWAEIQGDTLKKSIKDVIKGIKIAISIYY